MFGSRTVDPISYRVQTPVPRPLGVFEPPLRSGCIQPMGNGGPCNACVRACCLFGCKLAGLFGVVQERVAGRGSVLDVSRGQWVRMDVDVALMIGLCLPWPLCLDAVAVTLSLYCLPEGVELIPKVVDRIHAFHCIRRCWPPACQVSPTANVVEWYE